MAKRLAIQFEYQLCRNWGHAWDTFNASRNVKPKIYESFYQETLRCTRCGTERYRGIDFEGNIETPGYKHPEGYLMKKDERPEIAAFRLSVLQTLRAQSAQTKRTAARRKAPAKRATPRKAAHAKRRRVHA